VPPFRSDALALLIAHDYPGNVRELQNLVEGAVSLAEGEVGGDLVRSLLGAAAPQGPEPLDLETVERRHIARVLKVAGGNKSAAARILGLDRKTLQRKGF
jgi:DNA-binding NtrC family response regulator